MRKPHTNNPQTRTVHAHAKNTIFGTDNSIDTLLSSQTPRPTRPQTHHQADPETFAGNFSSLSDPASRRKSFSEEVLGESPRSVDLVSVSASPPLPEHEEELYTAVVRSANRCRCPPRFRASPQVRPLWVPIGMIGRTGGSARYCQSRDLVGTARSIRCSRSATTVTAPEAFCSVPRTNNAGAF
jgi:hypothetical protein